MKPKTSMQLHLAVLEEVRRARQNRPPPGRMANLEDLLGQKVGRWTVVKFLYHKRPHNYMLCRCQCGKEGVVTSNHLRKRRSLSCGCLRREARNAIKYWAAGTPEYSVWRGICRRCGNPDPRYKYYNGRGIEVCQEWRNNFDVFYRDMGPRPTAAHTIERKDNYKGYSPDNCVWATRIQQARNRRNQLWVTFKGQTLSLAEWAERLGLNYARVHQRIRTLGWDHAKALTTP